MSTFESRNPYTNEVIAEYPALSAEAIEEALESAYVAQREWAAMSFRGREQVCRRVADLIRDRNEELAALMTAEMGKPIAQSRAEVKKCATVFDYYADHAQGFLADQPIATDAAESGIVYSPLGVVLAIMPWNFPLWQVARFAAPALMAGNAGLLKHAPNVMGCASAFVDLLHDAGVIPGAFIDLRIDVENVERVIADRRVAAVTLTGSERAGRSVAELAGSSLKKCVLELGGSDPYVILADADVEAAAEACVTSRLINTGQSCIAAKRLITVPAIADAFEEAVVALMKAKTLGDPTSETTDLGPLARHDLRDTLHEQVRGSVAAGAKVVLGGEVPSHPGALYPATVLRDVTPGMPAYGEELFGPVASIIRANSEQEALAIANDTRFGLGAALFSADVGRARDIAARYLEAGSCFVNAFVRSDPRLPFGGIKASGFGRELSHLGIHEFVNAKTLYVA